MHVCTFYPSDKFEQFWSVNRRLMERTGDDPYFKFIPFRIFQVMCLVTIPFKTYKFTMLITGFRQRRSRAQRRTNVIRSVERYDLVKIKPTESEAEN